MEENNPSQPVAQTPVNLPSQPAVQSPKKQSFGKKWLILGLIFLFLIVVGGIAGYFYLNSNKQIACTTEAKLCPDGSSVGRTGPKCEFAPCPQAKVTPSPTTTGENLVGPDCKITGCNGEICANISDGPLVTSSCIYKNEYACYKTAKCEKQADGNCGWKITSELTACLNNNK